jgi:hypothetical protein
MADELPARNWQRSFCLQIFGNGIAQGPAAAQNARMHEVFANQDLSLVGYYKGLLDEAGIPCFIRNENGGNPDVAGISFLPTLCVISDADFNAAIAHLKANPAPAGPPRADWKCPACQQENPGNFELCWNCGKPDARTSAG